MRISDWSSDVCSSDLSDPFRIRAARLAVRQSALSGGNLIMTISTFPANARGRSRRGNVVRIFLGIAAVAAGMAFWQSAAHAFGGSRAAVALPAPVVNEPASMAAAETAIFARSEEHTSELQSLMRNPYSVF